MGNWFVVRPEAGTNLVTNPSFEGGTTGYSAIAGGALARSTTYQKYGLYSCRYTPAANTGDGIQYAITLTAATQYAFSVAIKGVDGVPYRIAIYDQTAGAVLGTPLSFVSDGGWARYVVVVTTGANTSIRLRVYKDNSASTTPFYVDGFMCQALGYATIYIDGDQDGCQWAAGAHQSMSSRSAQYRGGGRWIDLRDDIGLAVSQQVGTGMPPVKNITSSPGLADGSVFQRTIINERTFQLAGTITPTTTNGMPGYHSARKGLLNLVKPDLVTPTQACRIVYVGAGGAVAIDGHYDDGLGINQTSGFVEALSVRFRCPNPLWRQVERTFNAADIAAGRGTGASGSDGAAGLHGGGGGNGAVSSTVQQSLTSVNYLLCQGNDGVWEKMGTGLALPVPGEVSGGYIYAMAYGVDGKFYIGGTFTSVGGVSNTSRIAYWDGTTWNALGTGMNGAVYSLAVSSSGTLYAGGIFTTAGGVTALRVASWNGSSWSALGGVTDGQVNALVIDSNGILYAGGSFTTIGGVGANYIASWNGSSWSALGSGMNALVNGLAVSPSDILYAGGVFTTAGGVTVNYIASWNGSSWSALGSGMNAYVSGLAVSLSEILYAVGSFTTAGGVTVNYIAGWNGSSWSALGSGMNDYTYWLAISPKGILYAGGAFTTAGGVTASKIAYWNGSSWSALGSGVSGGNVLGVIVNANGMVYVCGSFTSAGGVSNTNSLALWNGVDWRTISTVARAIVQGSDGSYYVGGGFSQAGGVTNTSRIAKWNGTAWSALGTGANGVVHAIAEAPNGYIYIGGAFTQVGGVANTTGVAYWDGSAWHALSTGISGTVLALAFAPNGDLYIGGLFLTAGGVSNTKNLAVWDGSAFAALSTGANSEVNVLVFASNGDLYIGGAFTYLGSVAADYLGKWDGTAFSAVGSGINGYVNDLVFMPDGSLIITGTFTIAGGTTVNYIARWNGTTFVVLSSGFNAAGYALAANPANGRLYAGGVFTEAGGLELSDKVAVFDNNAWKAIGVDLPGIAAVEAICVNALGEIILGFDTAGTAVTAAVN